MQDGSVWCTGWNFAGQLGVGSANSTSGFVQAVSSGVQAIAAGGWHSMVLKSDGSLWGTGANTYGQLGDGSIISQSNFVLVAPKSSGVLHV